MESKFSLIDGTFTVKEAREIIVTLLETKIQYHNRESFSNEIRFGKTHSSSVNRKAQLIFVKSEFLALLKDLENESQLVIKAEINISRP